MSTLHDVASKAGVSVTTVSNVINSTGKFSQKTKNIVENAIKELNYIPNPIARGLKKNSLHNISIICEDINTVFSNQMIDGICDYSDKHSYSVSLTNLGLGRKMNTETFDYINAENSDIFKNSVKNAISTFLTTHTDGIIYIGIHPRDVSNILPDLSIPVVYLYSYTSSTDTCINYDDFQGARIAVEHLVQQGHTKIATISGAIDSVPSHKRLLGYQTALMEHNLSFLPEYFLTSNWHYEDGYNCCQALMSLPFPPTAIFVMSDLMAYGAINYAHDNGIRIPGDLSIIAFDDLPSSETSYPKLTSIHVPLFEMGQYAADSLIKLIENNNKQNYTRLFPCQISIRNSTSQI